MKIYQYRVPIALRLPLKWRSSTIMQCRGNLLGHRRTNMNRVAAATARQFVMSDSELLLLMPAMRRESVGP
ncbi:hypothetical protein ACFX19_005545 [Malus domestica]